MKRVGKWMPLSWDFLLLTLLAALLILTMLADSTSLAGYLSLVRLVLGLVFVLFGPGYALQALLFPRESERSGVGRIGLATGLSVAILPPLALVLDRLPWGLRAWPTMVALTLIMEVCALGALARRLHLPDEERYTPSLAIGLKGWWATQEGSNRRLYGLVVVALVFAIASAAAILILPKPGERFTEFYILGTEGQAADYPLEFPAGQIETITTGIVNREGVTSTYKVLVQVGDQLVGEAGPIRLDADAKWEQSIQMGFDTTGDDQQVVFTMEREGQPSPYRTLRLWVNIRPPLSP